jgi:hypothetical protein
MEHLLAKISEFTIIFITGCLTSLGFYALSKKIKFQRGKTILSINEGK